MGSAVYAARVVFKNNQEASEKAPLIEEFLYQMGEAEDFWQDGRGVEDYQGVIDEMQEKFPGLFDTLGLSTQAPHGDRQLNYLAGQIDSPLRKGEGQINLVENAVTFSGEVWHFADWGPLMYALKNKFGARDVNWLSDEYTDIDEILHQTMGGDLIESKAVTTVTVVDPDTGNDVQVEIRKMATGAMVGFDGSWLEQHDEHPFSPYDKNTRVVVPDDEK